MNTQDIWTSQFEATWERSLKKPTLTAGELFSSYNADKRFQVVVTNRMLNFMARQWMPCSMVAPLLSSPLEQQMFWSLMGVADGYAPGFRCRMNGQTFGDISELCVVEIEPQFRILEYRVDFRVSLSRFVQDQSEPGKMPQQKLRNVEVLVECDGHDFHSRTKEQAERDRSRDRMLQRLGYDVLRYTGSEIWKDSLVCAQGVLDHLESRLLSLAENISPNTNMEFG